MDGSNIQPALIGGRFTDVIAYFPPPTVLSGNGGLLSQTGYVGSASAVATDGFFTDNGSSSWLTATSAAMLPFSQGRKFDWSSENFMRDYSIASCEPFCGADDIQINDAPDLIPDYPFPISEQSYFANIWNPGEAGPNQNAVRNSTCWVSVASNPAEGNTDFTSVKGYPANQIQLSPLVPISQFKRIMGYYDSTSPFPPSQDYPQIIYESAWDIFGVAHTATAGISFECMFWTYNHNQNPGGIGPQVESGIDLNGDGVLWDLWVTADTAATGGQNAAYSYGIWMLQPQFQSYAESGWVNILAGVRFFAANYVVPSGEGAPDNALDCPLWYITRGWEPCNSDYQPVTFRLNDWRVDMA